MVIAAEDPGPGVENWLDTGGRLEGYMLVRWVLADGPPHPTAQLGGSGLTPTGRDHGLDAISAVAGRRPSRSKWRDAIEDSDL